MHTVDPHVPQHLKTTPILTCVHSPNKTALGHGTGSPFGTIMAHSRYSTKCCWKSEGSEGASKGRKNYSFCQSSPIFLGSFKILGCCLGSCSAKYSKLAAQEYVFRRHHVSFIPNLICCSLRTSCLLLQIDPEMWKVSCGGGRKRVDQPQSCDQRPQWAPSLLPKETGSFLGPNYPRASG